MASLSQYLAKVEAVNIELSAEVAIENTATAAIQAQKEQLQRGERSDGSFLPDYSFRSVFQYGKPAGPIRLYDQGDFYSGILIDVRPGIFLIDSADQKTTMLENTYGKDILGLGKAARIEYIYVLKPEFYKQIKSYFL